MKMIKELEVAFNKQMHEEMDSWYIYLTIAAWYEAKGLRGFANWMHVQAEEELQHAKRFRDYLMLRGNQVSYSAVGAGVAAFSGTSPVDGLKKGFEHEQHITKCISELYDSALSKKDHGATLFLEWFISEQEEEEDSIRVLLDEVAIAGDCGAGLFEIDKLLSERKLGD